MNRTVAILARALRRSAIYVRAYSAYAVWTFLGFRRVCYGRRHHDGHSESCACTLPAITAAPHVLPVSGDIVAALVLCGVDGTIGDFATPAGALVNVWLHHVPCWWQLLLWLLGGCITRCVGSCYVNWPCGGIITCRLDGGFVNWSRDGCTFACRARRAPTS